MKDYSNKSVFMFALLALLIVLGYIRDTNPEYLGLTPKSTALEQEFSPEQAQPAPVVTISELPLEDSESTRVIILSPRQSAHILYGDANGGGHKYGAGKPCKSEFPPQWDDEKIIGTIKRIAANDNLDWEQQQNSYFVAEDDIESLTVRVVLAEDKSTIITGYPVNVPRNPCPAPANDNTP